MKEILALLGAIPDILSLVKEFLKFVKAQLGMDWRGYLKDSTEAFKKLNAAKTQEEKYVAAEALQKLIEKL